MRETFKLACGVTATFDMPDMLKLIGGGIDIPNAALADVLALTNNRLNGYVPDVAQALENDKRAIGGAYELAALCLSAPRVVLPRHEKDTYGNVIPLKDGEISYRDLTLDEVLAVCAKFRFGIPLSLPAAADNQPGVGAAALPDGGDVSHAAEPVRGTDGDTGAAI